jgi:signal transduction histidine kinase
MVGDSAIAAVLFMFDMVVAINSSSQQRTLIVAIAPVLLAPLIWRRKAPMLSAYVILLGGYLQLFFQGSHGILVVPADLALGIALYSLVVYVGRRRAAFYSIWLAVGTVAWALWRVQAASGFYVVFISVVFALFWLAGEYLGARRARNAEVEARLALLETERDQQARITLADERTRIARELHDVVAHAVSVMIVQADGAAYAIRSNPDLAEQAVGTISATGRSALSELRRLLGVLRNETEADTGRVPQPDVSMLTDLADRITGIGVPVRLEMSGELDGLPAGVGLNIYRIIQEALTNTLKHAGAGATAVVRVTREDDVVEVFVDDDGHGPARPVAEVSGGNGLIGMRERTAVHGGTLTTGSVDGHGWRVHARLPIGSAT